MPVSGTAEGTMKRACEEGLYLAYISPISPLHLPYISR